MCGAISAQTGFARAPPPSIGPGPSGGTKKPSSIVRSAAPSAGYAPPAWLGGRVGAARLEGRALEEPVLVERLRELLDARGLLHLALVAKDRLLDLGEVVASVEERDDLEQRAREHHDRRRVAGGIAQRQEALALVLDGERLDAAQARPPRACPPGGRPCPPGGGAHGFRYASAAAA